MTHIRRTLSVLAVALTASTTMMAGDGTKANPYTVAELMAAQDNLTATDTVWVRANLKGLGADGSQTVNDADNRKDCAACFTDGTATFTAWSFEILSYLAMEDLTNTQDLLLSGVMREGSESKDEPEGRHFSLCQMEGALQLAISNGFRGFHVQSQYVVPRGMVAVDVRCGYSSKTNEATVAYTYTCGDTLSIMGKNSARVLMARDGVYDIVLTAAKQNQKAGTTSLSGGTQAGLNTVKTNNRYLYRFVADANRTGFERNSDNMKEVTLERKDEVYLQINALETNFFGHYAFDDGDTKKWIKWGAEPLENFVSDTPDAIVGVASPASPREFSIGNDQLSILHTLTGLRVQRPVKGINIVNGKKFFVK